MRFGSFEIILADGRKHPLPEMRINGQNCFAAVAGTEFVVKVNIYRDKDGRFPCDFMKVALYIDGADVKEWKRVDLTPEGTQDLSRHTPKTLTYYGFKDGPNSTRPFMFGALERGGSAQPVFGEELKKLGTVRMAVFEAYVDDRPFTPRDTYDGYCPEPRSVSENSKFWDTASLTTVAGGPRERESQFFRARPFDYRLFRTATQLPFFEMEVSYHSEDVITFLRDFHARNRALEEAQAAEEHRRKRPRSGGYGAGAISGDEEEDEEDEPVMLVDRAPSRAHQRKNMQVYEVY